MLDYKDYCDYETCVALRELGFTLDMTEKVYERNLMANRYETIPKPLLYEAQKWLREVKKIEVNATYDNIVELHWHWYMKSLANRNQTISNINYDSYEQALLAGIKEAVKILKESL